MSDPERSEAAEDTVDRAVVTGFGQEWARFRQGRLSPQERRARFADFFSVFPWDTLDPAVSVGADLGCGSGRWAIEVARSVRWLHLVDASSQALTVARGNMARAGITNVEFHQAELGRLPFADASLDFAYVLGVLHHIPNSEQALAAIVAKLKPGASLLLYLYYNFENRPLWFRLLWRVSDLLRRALSRMPFALRAFASEVIAVVVYYPFARTAALLERIGRLSPAWPLAIYRHSSFYTMRTDALDRFGTRLERRFSRAEIRSMLDRAGLEKTVFSEQAPYWCVCAQRRQASTTA
jgi:SAM-dependent methyltransferase